jgi:hypothetical protein
MELVKAFVDSGFQQCGGPAVVVAWKRCVGYLFSELLTVFDVEGHELSEVWFLRPRFLVYVDEERSRQWICEGASRLVIGFNTFSAHQVILDL